MHYCNRILCTVHTKCIQRNLQLDAFRRSFPLLLFLPFLARFPFSLQYSLDVMQFYSFGQKENVNWIWFYWKPSVRQYHLIFYDDKHTHTLTYTEKQIKLKGTLDHNQGLHRENFHSIYKNCNPIANEADAMIWYSCEAHQRHLNSAHWTRFTCVLNRCCKRNK